jgi:hypothetical protein
MFVVRWCHQEIELFGSLALERAEERAAAAAEHHHRQPAA